MPSPTEITVAQLSRIIGTPDSPTIIDVRIDEDFDADPRLLPTARRWPFDDIASLAESLRGKRVVVYCQKGKKISQGVKAILREMGISAESLEGGHFAWRDAEKPLIPFNKIPLHNSHGRSVWVTKQRPKIDRIACPWLIRRFIDPEAQFLFVAPSEVLAVAEKFNAEPFDVEDVFWTHRGDLCTFDIMVEEFDLKTKALDHLATIVRGADTNQHQLAPESAGLLAASLGLSRMYRDDNAQLDAGMLIYDAFYRWARDATNENHDWPQATTGQKPAKGK
ncbi:sulfurtransferase/chromate resistance protein [Cocleimonas sp. KMM 6892]|uniref:sulfurtransferase/chromate resistance protein n=1 Tax=unclassified Cocleimonas TaxID=2639732 RepID=UPI002DBBEFAF|nr:MULTISPECIES: sulfurtransferase/chromate resistance protein [unclassified Cocleimonas]MEB8434547.1 sulfurtransferase/chromate resistance protein [Cocleimonas sp. KMM 6892]MEC4717440.1 sulfurtransferase/chromate resistance protein [Cocleimonas sp. KMM 6895]MEC4746766.1 sulfurtransferase/chromate resistance protein [Cocleimonas sp. KMM 6896]